MLHVCHLLVLLNSNNVIINLLIMPLLFVATPWTSLAVRECTADFSTCPRASWGPYSGIEAFYIYPLMWWAGYRNQVLRHFTPIMRSPGGPAQVL
jgi:hypothetical protein